MIIHRDLKPENLLLSAEGHIKLTDFDILLIFVFLSFIFFFLHFFFFFEIRLSHIGLIEEGIHEEHLATNSEIDSTLSLNRYTRNTAEMRIRRTRVVGTPDYLAPEILLGTGHGPAVDWWALGVIVFEFVTGIPPFNDETVEQIFRNILSRDIPWTDENMSKDCRDFIDKLLTQDPSQRLGSSGTEKVKCHPFFAEITWETLLDHPFKNDFISLPGDNTYTGNFQRRESRYSKISFTDDETDSSGSQNASFQHFSFKGLDSLLKNGEFDLLSSQSSVESSKSKSDENSSS